MMTHHFFPKKTWFQRTILPAENQTCSILFKVAFNGPIFFAKLPGLGSDHDMRCFRDSASFLCLERYPKQLGTGTWSRHSWLGTKNELSIFIPVLYPVVLEAIEIRVVSSVAIFTLKVAIAGIFWVSSEILLLDSLTNTFHNFPHSLPLHASHLGEVQIRQDRNSIINSLVTAGTWTFDTSGRWKSPEAHIDLILCRWWVHTLPNVKNGSMSLCTNPTQICLHTGQTSFNGLLQHTNGLEWRGSVTNGISQITALLWRQL